MAVSNAPPRGAGLLWDTSTLRKGLQRKFFANLLEMTGSTVHIVQRTAMELSRLVDPAAPAEGLKQLYAGFENPDRIKHLLVYREDPRISIQHQIWWAEELLRTDSIYEVVLLNDEQDERYDRLMDSLAAAEILPGRTPDEVRAHPDAITICQAAALDGKIMVSPDQDFHANRVAANAWATGRHRAGELAQPMIVTRPERELEDWCAADPDAVLKAMVASAWPDDPEASRPLIEERLGDLADAMERVAYLRPTAQFCKQLYRRHREPGHLIETIRKQLPSRARAADQRHPAHPGNRQRNWSAAADAVRASIELPRWQITISEDSFRLLENQSGDDYTVTKRLPVSDRDGIIKLLVDQKIEVQGTPPHGGKRNQTGGFTIAMNGLIDEELAKIKARSR